MRTSVLIFLLGCASAPVEQRPVDVTQPPTPTVTPVASASATPPAPPPQASASPVLPATSAPHALAEPFDLQGYVVAVASCRCPPSARCGDCEESIVVSSEPRPTDRTMMGDGNLKVIVPSASKYVLGAKLKLVVREAPTQPFQNDPCCSRIGPYVVHLVSSP